MYSMLINKVTLNGEVCSGVHYMDVFFLYFGPILYKQSGHWVYVYDVVQIN